MEGNGASPGMKREFCGDDGDSSSKRLRGTGPNVDLRVLLPSRTAGAIIGKGGANIKRLRQDYNAQVTMPDTTGPERILNVSAELGAAIEVVLQVFQGIEADRGEGGGTSSGGDIQIRFLIHQSQAGAVIGKGGYKVKEFREMCGAHIKVYSECCPQSTERIVEVGGSMDTISKTAYSIFEFLQTAPPKGMNAPYIADNFDEYFSGEYGGYTNMDTGMGGARGGRGGARGLAGFGRGFGLRGAPRGGSRLMDNNYAHAPAAMGLGGGFDQDTLSTGKQGTMFGAQASEYTQVSIPKDMAGAIIGKGGARIKQIRLESGATITIDEPQVGSNDRIINISGTADQIQNAQYLLQMSVKQFAGGQHF